MGYYCGDGFVLRGYPAGGFRLGKLKKGWNKFRAKAEGTVGKVLSLASTVVAAIPGGQGIAAGMAIGGTLMAKDSAKYRATLAARAPLPGGQPSVLAQPPFSAAATGPGGSGRFFRYGQHVVYVVR
jgi:hypothetical protein